MRCRQEDLPFGFAKTAQIEKILECANNAGVLIGVLLVKSFNYFKIS